MSYWKRYSSMSSPFELQIHFNNKCNWIYAFLVESKICKHTKLHRRHGIYDKKKQGNLYTRIVYFQQGI